MGNWFYNNEDAINRSETDFITHESDLFSVVPISKSPLRNFLERWQWFRLLRIWRQRTEISTSKEENIHYISDKRIDNFIALLNTVLGVMMLIVPLWILAFLESLVQKLSVISAFIVLFLISVSLVTVAKTYESLAATAV